MPEPSDQEHVHTTATLLPWYLSNTLDEGERRQVDEHLIACDLCRHELDELTALRRQVQQAYRERPEASPGVFPAVMARVLAHVPTKSGRRAASSEGRTRPNAPNLIVDRVRGLLAARWVPVLASILIVAQFGLLVWALGLRTSGSSGHPGSAGPIVSRSVPMAGMRLRVAFQDTVPELNIRMAIRELKGRIVDGPTGDGVYTIEVPEAVAVDERIGDLRMQRQVFRSVERVEP
ncbi:MAG TPA: zf-HC2 domain-containing protein [Nitrospiraceae bacterium]|nr:zf-HC2 domain-containing protein [Nitrospiraceae bacterium]